MLRVASGFFVAVSASPLSEGARVQAASIVPVAGVCHVQQNSESCCNKAVNSLLKLARLLVLSQSTLKCLLCAGGCE